MRSYGLIGFPLGHSFSRQFFTDKFRRENKQEEYLNFEIPEISLLPAIISGNPGLLGLNVTIPYKEQVIPFMDRLDEIAGAIRAVNTIRIFRNPEGYSLEGFNTDVYGFTNSIRPLLKSHHRKVLILGTGGASKAVKYSLEKLGIEWLQVSRELKNEKCIPYGWLDKDLMQEYTVIVNTTPLGTYPETAAFPPVPYDLITPHHLLYDLVYNPAETRFLSLGKDKGAVIKNGYEMLELQALRSYAIWNSEIIPLSNPGTP
jgi:shikimate dehydrogenase